MANNTNTVASGAENEGQAVILADDNTVNRVVVGRMAEKITAYGTRIVTCTGDDLDRDTEVIAATLAGVHDRVALILDEAMPGGDGIAFLEKIKGLISKDPDTRHPNIVVFPYTAANETDFTRFRDGLLAICQSTPGLSLGGDLRKPLASATLRRALYSAGFIVKPLEVNPAPNNGDRGDVPLKSAAYHDYLSQPEDTHEYLSSLKNSLKSLLYLKDEQAKKVKLKEYIQRLIDRWDGVSHNLGTKGNRLLKIMFHTTKGYAGGMRAALILNIDLPESTNQIIENLIEMLEAIDDKPTETNASNGTQIAFNRLAHYYGRTGSIDISELPSDLGETTIPAWHIQIATMNLIKNAQSAGANNIWVTVTQDESHINITVSDNGSPFPTDWTPKAALQGEGGRTGNGLRDIEYLGITLDFSGYREPNKKITIKVPLVS